MDQLIVSIGREYGSGGHEIAVKLAQKLGLKLYDRNMLEEIAKHKNVDYEELAKYDEAPKKEILTRTVRGLSNSHEYNIANMQFEYLRKKASEGESFVVVGRCAESVLKDFEGLISVFILGDIECRIQRISRVRNMSESEARSAISRHDKTRKAYHNSHSSMKWGDARNYDITLNSSKLGIDDAVDLIAEYINKRTVKR